jgi:hypothetical protein
VAGGVAQVAENLLSKCEALSSNPSTTKKRKRKRTTNANEDMGKKGTSYAVGRKVN